MNASANNPNGLFPDDFGIVSALVNDALAKGYSLSVHDGEAWSLKRSTDKAAVIGAIGTTDMDTVRLRKPCGTVAGNVVLVYGNRDWTTIADYTDTPEIEAMAEAAERAGGAP